MIKGVFFDAFGTLFHLTKTVGEHYTCVARDVGLRMDAHQLDAAFHAAWQTMPLRPSISGPRENDDKMWWRRLVDLVLAKVCPQLNELDRENFFQVAYAHFAEPDVWQLYPEVVTILEELNPRFQLAVVSNFDGRLRLVLRHLAILKYFPHVFISSELGADKPDPEIFRRSLKLSQLQPSEVIYVGDDPERDWTAAEAAGISVFRLERPKNSLRDLSASFGTR